MDNILYINACVRQESRTNMLAQYLLEKLEGNIEEIKLSELNISPLNETTLSQRDNFIKNQNFQDKMFNLAKQFANTDIIIIAAPYWDLSFPALLKTYFELTNVTGITFQYSENGMPQSLCKAKKLIYITTSGGPCIYADYGYEYVKKLAETFYGISDIKFIQATGLDVIGNNTEDILNNAKTEIDKIL